MSLERIKSWSPYLVILGVFGIAYHGWLSFDVFTVADWWYFSPQALAMLLDFSSWDSSISALGSQNIILWSLPFKFAYGLFGKFGFAINVAEKFLFFWPFVFLTPVFSYLLLRRIIKNNIGSFIGALVFSANTYFLSINSHGHQPLAVSATWSLFGFYWLVRSLEEKRIRLLLLGLFFFFLGGSYDFRFFYMSFFVLFGYLFYYFIFIRRSEWKNWLKYSALGGAILAGLNLFWLLPTVMGGSLTDNWATSRDIIGNNFWLDISRALTLFHPFWTGGAPSWFNTNPIPFYFWLIPLAAFSGLWLNRRNKEILFWGFVALVGVFLSKQEGEPFGSLYSWLYENLPGFNAFREATKFYFLTALGYSVLVGALVGSLWRRVESGKVHKVYKVGGFIRLESYQINKIAAYFLTVLLGGIFLWNLKPVLTGTMGGMHEAKVIPKSEIILKEFIQHDRDFGRILWIPSEPRFAYFDELHPKVKGTDGRRYFWQDFIVGDDGTEDDPSTNDKTLSLVTQDFSNGLMDLSSVRYIVSDKQGFFYDGLEKLDYLEEIPVPGATSAVFLNADAYPRLSLSREPASIYRGLPAEKFEYVAVSPAEYSLWMKKISGPVYLNFSDTYHAQWKLHPGSFSWTKAFGGEYFLADSMHFRNDAGLNSFLLDPAEICQSGDCRKNADGSYDFELTLFYRPQASYYLGLILSGVTLLAILAYLIYPSARKLIIRNKKHAG